MSSVRNYFELREGSLTCKICGKAFSSQASGTTSHLWAHLGRKHSSVYQQAKSEVTKKKESVSIKRHSRSSTEGPAVVKKETPVSANCLVFDNSTQNNCDAAVLKFIVADDISFESAAGVGFRNLCSVLTNGLYQPPHVTTLLQKLDGMATNLHQTLVQSLWCEITDCRPSVTFDHWKADNRSNYLVLTLHYISESSWVMKSRCLSVVNLGNFEADCAPTKSAEIISREFSKYRLSEEKILFATTDSTNTMSCTARILDIQWHGCAVCTLQLAIQAALDAQKTTKNLLSHLNDIASFFHSSSVGQGLLTKYQINKGLPESKPPVTLTSQSNPYLLLDWVNRNYDSISLTLVDCEIDTNLKKKIPPQPLSQQLQDTLKNILSLLRPTAEAATILSAATHVSISLIIPCISVLKEELVALAKPDIKFFLNELLCQLDSRFDLSKDYLLAATFIDPRFKTLLFPEHQVKQAKVYIENLALSCSPGPGTTTTNNCTSVKSTAVSKSNHEGSLLDSMFKKVYDIKKEETVTSTWSMAQQIESETSTYLKQSVSERDSDPLKYWKDNQSILPLLSGVACSLLAVQATNCSDRINSVDGQTIANLHNNLSKNNSETLIWARQNKDLLF